MSEDDKNGMAKIIRIPENNLIVPTTESELKYRDKFLPGKKIFLENYLFISRFV